MEQVTQSINPSIPRDYDKNPIKIINYSVLFESHLIILIVLVAIPFSINDIYKIILENGPFTLNLVVTALLGIYFMYLIFIDYPKKYKDKPSCFVFYQNTIQYHHKYLQIDKDDLILTVPINQINQISFSLINELPESYGRWNIDSTWKTKRKLAIDISFSELIILIRYVITYLLFILPYKVRCLYKAGERFTLLRKNLFIQFYNRNYFLVNIYSQKDLDELLEYFSIHNIAVSEKTYFIPHLQDQGWFVDKEEIWTDEFNQKGEK
jgi:hypothetical protein